MKTLLVLAMLLSACHPYWPDGDPDLYGIVLEVHPSPEMRAFVDRQDFKQRLRVIFETTAIFLEHKPEEFAGMKLVIVSGLFDCNGPGKDGCYDWGSNTMTVSTGWIDPKSNDNWMWSCVDDMVIPHEAIHYFIGDWDHHSPLFDKYALEPLWLGLHNEIYDCNYFYSNHYEGFWAR